MLWLRPCCLFSCVTVVFDTLPSVKKDIQVSAPWLHTAVIAAGRDVLIVYIRLMIFSFIFCLTVAC